MAGIDQRGPGTVGRLRVDGAPVHKDVHAPEGADDRTASVEKDHLQACAAGLQVIDAVVEGAIASTAIVDKADPGLEWRLRILPTGAERQGQPGGQGQQNCSRSQKQPTLPGEAACAQPRNYSSERQVITSVKHEVSRASAGSPCGANDIRGRSGRATRR